MIPKDYVCSVCGTTGVKLWRPYQSCAVHLFCGACAEKDQGKTIDLSVSDQCRWLVPAVPTLDGSWWGYTSVPAEGCAWWKALPLALAGEWKVRGGVERWMPYSTWTMLKPQPELRRVDWSRDRGMALAFVPDGGVL